MKQNRFKSFVLWSAIVAQAISILQFTGVFKSLGLDAGTVGNIVAGILQVLVAAGVLNNPSDAEKF